MRLRYVGPLSSCMVTGRCHVGCHVGCQRIYIYLLVLNVKPTCCLFRLYLARTNAKDTRNLFRADAEIESCRIIMRHINPQKERYNRYNDARMISDVDTSWFTSMYISLKMSGGGYKKKYVILKGANICIFCKNEIFTVLRLFIFISDIIFRRLLQASFCSYFRSYGTSTSFDGASGSFLDMLACESPASSAHLR